MEHTMMAMPRTLNTVTLRTPVAEVPVRGSRM
jgi:hypothetical protein